MEDRATEKSAAQKADSHKQLFSDAYGFGDHADVIIEQKTFEIAVPPGKTKAEAVAKFQKEESAKMLNEYNQQRASLGLKPVDQLPSFSRRPVSPARANLPVIPGINAPLPPQTVERTGGAIVPLGARH